MAVLGTLLWAVGIVCAIWVIYDVLTIQSRMSTGEKILWVIAALIFNIITAIVYYLVKKK